MIHLSFSQYNIWKTCPFQWKLLYIDKIKIPSASIDLVFGSSLHHVLQEYLDTFYKLTEKKANELDLEKSLLDSMVKEIEEYRKKGIEDFTTPEELIETVPELKNMANIKCKFVANIQSESMRFPHYNLIAKAIEKEIKETKPKGIIITHGTDTLHYTSAALSFILENLSIPIILVGAQRSSDRGSSDSHMNLICATKFIKETDFHGVAICMHNSMNDDKCAILPGTKTRKMHTSRRDAFKPINSEKIALINYDSDKIEMFEKTKPKPKENLKLKLIKEDIKVGILKSHTNIYPENIKHFKNYDGLIIEGTGLGHFQTKSFDKISEIEEKNKKELEKLLKDTIILLSSQCIFGRVNLNVYTPQRELKEIGVMGTEDMTTETAFIKLAWLLSNYKKEEIRKLVTQNLRGEIIKCSNTNSLK